MHHKGRYDPLMDKAGGVSLLAGSWLARADLPSWTVGSENGIAPCQPSRKTASGSEKLPNKRHGRKMDAVLGAIFIPNPPKKRHRSGRNQLGWIGDVGSLYPVTIRVLNSYVGFRSPAEVRKEEKNRPKNAAEMPFFCRRLPLTCRQAARNAACL